LDVRCSMFDVLSRNLFLSRSDTRILASHKVAGMTMLELCPERTLEKHIISTVLSGRQVTPRLPATAWLANFRRRFATKNGFSKACRMLDVGCFPPSGASPFQPLRPGYPSVFPPSTN
jgi:hypothetical protein